MNWPRSDNILNTPEPYLWYIHVNMRAPDITETSMAIVFGCCLVTSIDEYSIGITSQCQSYHNCSQYAVIVAEASIFDTSMSEQNGWHFADDSYKLIFVNEPINEMCSWGSIDNKFVLVQMMDWRRRASKSFSAQMTIAFSLTYIPEMR